MTQLSFLEDETPQGMSWIGQRHRALERLDVFAPKAGKAYAGGRNFDFGPERRGNVSCLSPWIKHRLLREEDVLQATLARHSLIGAEKFIQEVFWRSYFKGWLEHRPSVWSAYCADVSHAFDHLPNSVQTLADYEAAITGSTGIACFDNWAQELVKRGYLHNHARMWFASIWIFTLRLPWQLGADFFLRHLLDGDVAANTLSWRWVGGLHTKGKTYLARPDNIEKYTGGRFAPDRLALIAEPLFERDEHMMMPLPRVADVGDLPTYGLILTQEDCHAESLPLANAPKATLSLSTLQVPSPLPTSEMLLAFGNAAVADALNRTQTHFECPVDADKTANWAEAMIAFAKKHDVTTLVTAYAAVGPVRDKIEAAQPVLEAAGICLLFVQRRYDQICWPHATKGFFKLKKKMPDLIADLGLE